MDIQRADGAVGGAVRGDVRGVGEELLGWGFFSLGEELDHKPPFNPLFHRIPDQACQWRTSVFKLLLPAAK